MTKQHNRLHMCILLFYFWQTSYKLIKKSKGCKTLSSQSEKHELCLEKNVYHTVWLDFYKYIRAIRVVSYHKDICEVSHRLIPFDQYRLFCVIRHCQVVNFIRLWNQEQTDEHKTDTSTRKTLQAPLFTSAVALICLCWFEFHVVLARKDKL